MNFISYCNILFLVFAHILSSIPLNIYAQSLQSQIADELPICQVHNEFLPQLMHNTGSFGNMFEVRTKEYPVKVTEISFSTDLHSNVTYHAWTKTGTYNNHESNEESWTKIAEGWTIGLGKQQPTPIPAGVLTPLWIEPQQTQAFLVMLETADIRYNYGSIEGAVLEEHNDLILLEGKSVAHFPPFADDTTFFSPRIFTGAMKYVVERPCDEPSSMPSFMPSVAPSNYKLSSSPSLLPSIGSSTSPSLSSTSTKVDYRYKFLVEYNEVVSVSNELHNITEKVLKGYFDDGEETSQKNQIIERGELKYEGIHSLSILDSTEIDCDDTNSNQECLGIESSVVISHNHEVSKSEVTFAMLSLKDLVYPLLSFTNKQYIGMEPLETVNTFRCYGVAYEAFDDEDTIIYLEEKVMDFLGSVQDQADIMSVSVLERNMVEAPEKNPFFRRMLQIHAARSRSHVLQDTSSVDLTIAVTGEYQPPPEIQFDELTKDSFDNEGDALVELLQKGENEKLKKITKIKPVEESRLDEVVEEIAQPLPIEDKSPLVPIIASVIGVCIIALFFFLVWGKQTKENENVATGDNDNTTMMHSLQSESIENFDRPHENSFGYYDGAQFKSISARSEFS